MSSIRVLDPNAFMQAQQTQLPSAEAEALAQVHGGGPFPRANFCFISRLEADRPYLRFPIAPHRPSFYSIMAVSRGDVVRTDGLNTYKLGAGSIFCHPAGRITAVESASVEVQGYYCLFDAEYFLDPFSNKALLDELPVFQSEFSPVLQPEGASADHLFYLLGCLEAEADHPHPDQATSMATLLYTFFLAAKKHSRSLNTWLYHKQASAAETLMHKFKRLLQQHVLRKKAVAEYADLLAVTPNHLNRCVKQISGRTAKDMILDMLLLEACVLLKQTEATVSEIAYQLGFATPSHFVKLFRIRQGFTPLEYRHRALGRGPLGKQRIQHVKESSPKLNQLTYLRQICGDST
ncbi:helix-turn-helix transcriptional regulator [Hymenobacter sp. BT664]|uniref:Helix-turn-helix transcriptional regulator n=1 Tax=Hymenobacter montanus TaxID=2771359 RepID=A0A927BF84_9BACT|nr:AraC family transcriptional regulator [Hymenobacter montanus]MBD2769791.1 helix-turn-helix transcriptional regulator [Hymenobacter montanus]